MNNASRTRELNDLLRTQQQGGQVFLTANVAALDWDKKEAVLKRVVDFSDFDEDNDPYGEHDFGAFELGGERYFFKIDYYSNDMMHLSEDPADPEKTRRVLTIMHASEY